VSDWLQQRQEINQAFVRGTRRAELPIIEKTLSGKLGLLAAVAARARFELPQHPTEFEQEQNQHNDNPQHVASMDIRSALCRYFRTNRKSDHPHSAVVRVFKSYQKRNLHVHRFDYVQLKPLLSIDASLFDTPFRRWASRRTSTEGSLHEQITPENWLEFSNPERCDFIRDLHQRDATTTRALLSECLAQETASVRGKLLGAIEASVTADDREFLETLLKDRAKSVKDIVATMLGGIEGSVQYNERLEEAVSRLSIKVSKLRKKKSLDVEQPGGYKSHRLAAWYAQTFNGINPESMAKHLDVDVKEFCDLIDKKGLAFECITQLARQQNHKLMVTLASRHTDGFMKWMSTNDISSLQMIDDKTKEGLWSALLGNASMQKLGDWVHAVERIYLSLKLPVPAQLSESLINSKDFKKGLDVIVEEHAPRHFEIVERLVAVLQPSAYSALMAKLEGVPSVYTTQANQLILLLNLLESDQ